MLRVAKIMESQQILYPPNVVKEPEISVVLPTYCRGKSTLNRAIQSVLDQSYENFELIIVDDGSRDGTYELIRKHQEEDNRIILIHHPINSGLPAVRANEGVMLARGKYIAYQFDDDEWLPDCLTLLHDKRMEINEACVIYGTCEANLFDGKKNILKTKLGRAFDREYFYNNNFIANNAVLHDKEIVEKCGLYDPHLFLRRSCDYDLWLRYSKKYPMIWVEDVVSKVSSGGLNSLGRDISMDIIKYSNIRKYITIERDNALLPCHIGDYLLDDLYQYHRYFSQEDIFEYNMQIAIPFNAGHNYNYEKVPHIQAKRKIEVLLSKKLYDHHLDSLITQQTDQYRGYHFYYLCEGELSYVHRSSFDMLMIQGPTYTTTVDMVKEFHEKPLLFIEGDESRYPPDELYNYRLLKTKAQVILTQYGEGGYGTYNALQVAKFKLYLGKREVLFMYEEGYGEMLAHRFASLLRDYGLKVNVNESIDKKAHIGYIHCFNMKSYNVENIKNNYKGIPISQTSSDGECVEGIGVHCYDVSTRGTLSKRSIEPIHRFLYPMHYSVKNKKASSVVIYADGLKQSEIRSLMSEYKNLRRNYQITIVSDHLRGYSGLHHNIVPVSRIEDALESADYYLHLSEDNKYLIRGMELGCIPLAVNHYLSKEVIKDGYNGFLLEELSLTQVIVKIAKLNHVVKEDLRKHNKRIIEYYGDDAFNAHEALQLMNETVLRAKEEV